MIFTHISGTKYYVPDDPINYTNTLHFHRYTLTSLYTNYNQWRVY